MTKTPATRVLTLLIYCQALLCFAGAASVLVSGALETQVTASSGTIVSPIADTVRS